MTLTIHSNSNYTFRILEAPLGVPVRLWWPATGAPGPDLEALVALRKRYRRKFSLGDWIGQPDGTWVARVHPRATLGEALAMGFSRRRRR